ncbi:MAG TPA: superinfection immunity protein [Caulobacteraceae bacterium]|jgi:hypothetical protein
MLIVGEILLIAAYFLPTIVAVCRRHPNAVGIGLLNLTLGWTVLGWIGALIWSSTAQPEREGQPRPAIPVPLLGDSARDREVARIRDQMIRR